MRYIRQVAHETNGEAVYGLGRQPAVLRTFSQRLSRLDFTSIYKIIFLFSSFDLNCFLFSSFSTCRGFSDAVNGFNDDGWSIMHCSGAEDIIVAVNYSMKHLNSISDSLSFIGGLLCAKASMLIQVSSNTLLSISVTDLESFSTHLLVELCLFWCTLH